MPSGLLAAHISGNSEVFRELFETCLREASHQHHHSVSLSPILRRTSTKKSDKMAPSNLPSVFNATSQDIEMLLAAQCHLGSKNLQVHMEPYLWKTRADGVNVLNIGKTWFVAC